MAKQQKKRRRKRYEPGSAYAGDVKPKGVLSFISSGRVVQVVFLSMVFALGAGSLVAIFSIGVLTGTTGGSGGSGGGNFVLPGDNAPRNNVPIPDETTVIRSFDAPPPITIDPDKKYVATIKTAAGDIEVKLAVDEAPETVSNFVFLAEEGFYDGLVFHFVLENFSANAGDPSCTVGGAGCSGSGGPGYDLTEQVDGTFAKGTLGMVNGSQFFIALSDSEADQERYAGFTPFGQITSGLDSAERLAAGTAIESIEIQ